MEETSLNCKVYISKIKDDKGRFALFTNIVQRFRNRLFPAETLDQASIFLARAFHFILRPVRRASSAMHKTMFVF